jgi:hypothetical protein
MSSNFAMDNVILKDVGEVFIQDLSNLSNIYFFGLNDKVDLTQKISTNTILKSRIGDLPTALIQGGKEMDFTVTPVMYTESNMAMSAGSDVINGETTVNGWEDVVITGGKGTLKATPTVGTTSVTGFNSKGVQSLVTLVGQAVTVTTNVPADGNSIKVMYPMTVTGNILDLNAANMPKAFRIYYHNVFFDPDTNATYAQLYITFNKGVSDGAIALSLSSSKEAALPVKFTLLTLASSTSFGTYVTVPELGVLDTPTVTPQATATHGTVITLTFPDAPLWRNSITDITVNSVSAQGSYTVLPSMIKLGASLTPIAGSDIIVIKSANFDDVTITQVTE